MKFLNALLQYLLWTFWGDQLLVQAQQTELQWPFTIFNTEDPFNNSAEVWYSTRFPQPLDNNYYNLRPKSTINYDRTRGSYVISGINNESSNKDITPSLEEGFYSLEGTWTQVPQLPECQNVSIRKEDFVEESAAGHEGVRIPAWDASASKENLHKVSEKDYVVCLPYSEMLGMCFQAKEELILVSYPGEYVLLQNRSVFINSTQDIFKIGDYYLSPEKNRIFTCNVPCRNVTLTSEPYVIRKNSNELYVTPWRKTFSSHEYHVASNGTVITVCYPFTRRFRDCLLSDKAWGLDPQEFVVFDNKSLIHYSRTVTEYELGTYMINGDTAFVCEPENDEYTCPKFYNDSVQLVCYFLSIVSLIIALLVRLCTADMKRNYHRSSVCYLISLLAYYLCHAINLISVPRAASSACYASAALTQFFVLSIFTWLNVVACTIHHGSKTLIQSTCDSTNRRFLMYSIYGWVVPLAITLGTLVVDLELPSTSALKPRMETCRPNNINALSLFIYLPVAISLAISLFLYCLTLQALTHLARQAARINPKAPWQVASRLFKYVIFMGLFWIFEVTIFFVTVYWKLCSGSLPLVILDGFFALQGLFILLIGMWDRYGHIKKWVGKTRISVTQTLREKFFSDTYNLSPSGTVLSHHGGSEKERKSSLSTEVMRTSI